MALDLPRYLLGVAEVVALAGFAWLGAAQVRHRLLPDFSGAPAHLATAVLALALLIWTAELLGTFGLLEPLPYLAAVAMAGLGTWAFGRGSHRPDGAGLSGPARRSATGTEVLSGSGRGAPQPPGPASPALPGTTRGAHDDVARPTDEDALRDRSCGGRRRAASGHTPTAAEATPPQRQDPWAVRLSTLIALVVAALAVIHFSGGVRDALGTGMTGFDSTWYHGPFAAGFFQGGDTWGLHFVAPQFLAWLYPANAEVLHATGMLAFDRDVLSPLLNLGWLLGCLVAAWCIGRPFGIGPRWAFDAAPLRPFGATPDRPFGAAPGRPYGAASRRPFGMAPWSLALTAVALSVPAFADQAGEARNDIAGAFFLLAAVAIALNAPSAGMRRRLGGGDQGEATGGPAVDARWGPPETDDAGRPSGGRSGGDPSGDRPGGDRSDLSAGDHGDATGRPRLPGGNPSGDRPGGDAPGDVPRVRSSARTAAERANAPARCTTGVLVVVGLAAGLAAGTKLNFLLPAAVLVVGLALVAPRGGRLRALAATGLTALAGGGYWYLRNLAHAGNPLPWIDRVGPLSLPAPDQALGGREGHSVLGYLTDGAVWTDWLLPGLHDGLWLLWPLLVGAGVAGLVLCVVAPRTARGRPAPPAGAPPPPRAGPPGTSAVAASGSGGSGPARSEPEGPLDSPSASPARSGLAPRGGTPGADLRRLLAVAGLTGLAAFVAWLAAPTSASGPEGTALGFESGLRYLVPALALGLALLPAAVTAPPGRLRRRLALSLLRLAPGRGGPAGSGGHGGSRLDPAIEPGGHGGSGANPEVEPGGHGGSGTDPEAEPGGRRGPGADAEAGPGGHEALPLDPAVQPGGDGGSGTDPEAEPVPAGERQTGPPASDEGTRGPKTLSPHAGQAGGGRPLSGRILKVPSQLARHLSGRGTSTARLAGLALLVAVAVAAGYPVQRHYLESRYADPAFAAPGLNAAFAWARDVSGARIATTATRQYPLFGADLSNRVEFVGVERPHGGFVAPTTCRAWRRLLNEGDYDYVVATRDRVEAGKPPYPPEAAWTEAPGATVVLRKPPTVVYRLRAPLDPSACP